MKKKQPKSKDNTIITHPIKTEWSREEVIQLLRDILYDSNSLVETFPDGTVNNIIEDEESIISPGFKQWIEKNL